jgi:hypothetical protein
MDTEAVNNKRIGIVLEQALNANGQKRVSAAVRIYPNLLCMDISYFIKLTGQSVGVT